MSNLSFRTEKKYIMYLMTFVLVFLCFSVFVQGVMAINTGLDETAKVGFGDGETIPTNITEPLSTKIGKIVGAGLAFIGILFFLLMIYGGFIWMIARGNEQEVTKAKDLIYSAIIGLVIVLAAYAITAYLGGALGVS
ncbi:MAG: hypothetical protein ABIE43_01400 [Patescibacteria group bacterium]